MERREEIERQLTEKGKDVALIDNNGSIELWIREDLLASAMRELSDRAFRVWMLSKSNILSTEEYDESYTVSREEWEAAVEEIHRWEGK